MPSCLQHPGLEMTKCDEVRAGGSYSSDFMCSVHVGQIQFTKYIISSAIILSVPVSHIMGKEMLTETTICLTKLHRVRIDLGIAGAKFVFFTDLMPFLLYPTNSVSVKVCVVM